MNPILRLLSSGVADATSLARMVAETGLRSVSEVFAGTSIYGSLTAATNAEVIHDETHYLLVPLLRGQSHFAVYSKRVLPPGIGAMNSLPKARIFHLPDDSGKAILEDQLIQSMIQQRAGKQAGSSDLADSLELVAEKIDEETGKISGGLILIGGAVAFVNPLLGAGIIVKGLLPSIGSMASKAGAAYVGKKLRDWNQSTAEAKVRKDAAKEVSWPPKSGQ